MAVQAYHIESKLKAMPLKVKELRKEKGYKSYETFALAYYLDRKQYWRVENGANITIVTLIKILEIHQISLKDFFDDLPV